MSTNASVVGSIENHLGSGPTEAMLFGYRRRIVARFVAFLIGVLAAASGLAVWWFLAPSGPISGVPVLAITGLVLIGAFTALMAVFGLLLLASMTWLMPTLPALAAISTVAAYLSGFAQNGAEAIFVGLVAMTIGWFVFGVAGLDRSKASSAQPRSYAELEVRIEQLRGRLNAVTDTAALAKPAYNEAVASLAAAGASLNDGIVGPQWASAIGYINVWRTVHRTEEALIDVDLVPGVVAGALVDDMRLDGATIPGGRRLKTILGQAVQELDPSAATQYLKLAPAPAPPAGVLVGAVGDYRSRAMLREVRRAINEFRDARMEDIVRSRNLLRRTFAFAAVVSCTLLAVAVLSDTPRSVIASGTALFLVAALVGLFSRLRNSSVAQSTVDDFGLYEAQLLAGPLVSGIAGIGGVILIAAAPVAAAALSTVNGGAGEAATAAPTLNLIAIFDLARNPLAVVFAAIFGLTPDLLLSQLQQQTDRLKEQIRSSYVADKSADNSEGEPEQA